MSALELGQVRPIRGNVTKLRFLPFANPAAVEQAVGYGSGRLNPGYWMLLLKQKLVSDDRTRALEDARHFEFAGTTLRSGGRLGKPLDTPEDDNRRPTVRSDILKTTSEADYLTWKVKLAAAVPLTGLDRLAKILPIVPHDNDLRPSEQYPMGGGGLQWDILATRPLSFLVALRVMADGTAVLPSMPALKIFGSSSTNLYDNVAKVSRYLQTV